MRKRITLYTTNYPAHMGRRWIWLDAVVYGSFPPRGVGNLPPEVFNKLQAGTKVSSTREYSSKEKAIIDLLHTGCVEAAPPGTKAIKPRPWLFSTELVLKENLQ